MEVLLEKTRALNKLIQKSMGNPIDFIAIAEVLSRNIEANVYLVGRRGKILGYSFLEGFTCEIMVDIVLHSECFPESYNRKLLLVAETKANLEQTENTCFFYSFQKCPLIGKKITVIPIVGCGERLGSLILTRIESDLGLRDLILAEHGATVVGMEIMRIKAERVEEDTRRKAAVQIALSTLSFSEIEAAEHIFFELGGSEGLLVASRIADQLGITRSVVVNALRKLESAGIIKVKSLGMKGTYIRVLNKNLLEELKRIRWNKRVR